MRVAGIDPGLSSGGLAIVEVASPNDSPVLIATIDVPTLGDDHRKRVDAAAVARFLTEHKVDRVVIERAQAMPERRDPSDPKGFRRGQGATSGFKYGRAVGALEAAPLILGIPLSTVETVVWRRHYGFARNQHADTTSKKHGTLELARKLFGESAFPLVKDHNKAEAALIASYAARFYVENGGGPAAPRQAPVKSRKGRRTVAGNPNDHVRSKPAQGTLF